MRQSLILRGLVMTVDSSQAKVFYLQGWDVNKRLLKWSLPHTGMLTHLGIIEGCSYGDLGSVTFHGVDHPVNDDSTSNTQGWTVFKHHITNEGLFALEFSFFSWWRLIRCSRIHLIKQHATLKIKCHVQLLWEEWLILTLRKPFACIFPSSYQLSFSISVFILAFIKAKTLKPVRIFLIGMRCPLGI